VSGFFKAIVRREPNTVELGGNRYPVVSYVKLTTHTSYHRSRDHGWFALFRYA
jgi:hypothetical protein